ncbi:serine/threonine-protein kinase [Streptomyces sp. NRRL F-5123]|uniref:serine/threonine-protein kinase n=1 Tax=Streptomyces sp. NRRL F-5123 TaxID=1463856 RepID=UPI0004E14E17|nr:serine/threonine-protein kinase [Streptomyces sp. NRRL F-5123]
MGEVFAGRYELVDPIGRGGTGAVWRAWDQRRRRYVAAKVLQQRDAHALLRFVREQAMRIDHPHVLAPASWAADDDKVLFTMDLVRGGSLSHLVGDYGPLPPHYVCVLLDQLLAGLHAVHTEGIIHRDIKPANILLEATGTGAPHVRLSDFGIAMRQGEPRLTDAHFVVGTPGYFAPEQLQGAEPAVAADLYAVGLVALYLLSGLRPDAEAVNARFLADGAPPAPREVPRPLWQVLVPLLQPDPQARFRTALGARKALAGAVELLPEPPAGEEPVEIFDHVGPLPEGFGPEGPARAATGGSTYVFGPPVTESGPVPGPEATGVRPRGAAQSVGHPLTAAAEPSAAHPPTRADVPAPAAQPAVPPPPGPAPAPVPVPAPAAGADPGTPQPRAQPQPLPPPATAGARRGAHRTAPQRRPGPPRSVVIPVLVVAVLCFAVGIVALATG